MVFIDLSWIHVGGFLRKKSSNGSVGVSLDGGVEVFDERIVCSDDVGNDYVQPVITLFLNLCIWKCDKRSKIELRQYEKLFI